MTKHRKLENASLALSIFGAILIVPPLLNVFNVEVLIFGVPLIIIYLFSLWVLLIIATFLLSKKLVKKDENIIVDDEGES